MSDKDYRPRPDDCFRWLGSDGGFLKRNSVYRVKQVRSDGSFHLYCCEGISCGGRQGSWCTCYAWSYHPGGFFELVEVPLIENPNESEIRSAKPLPSSDEAASFFGLRPI